MPRCLTWFVLFWLNASGILLAQKGAADPTQRYFRLICLVHLTGSGKAGDPIVPEYVVAGTAVAQASLIAAAPLKGTATATAGSTAPATTTPSSATPPLPAPISSAAPPVPRPGFLAWSMQKSDDGTMAIVHIVAADPKAFVAILADTRPEIRVFQIGKDSAETIQSTMQQYKKDFNLASFEVPVQ
jgi:hypothetical protein